MDNNHRNRDSSDALLESGRRYAKFAQWKEAITDFQRFAQENDSDPRAFYYLGLVYMQMNSYQEAIDVLKKAVDRMRPSEDSKKLNYYFKYAFACQKGGQLGQAIEFYTKYIDIASKDQLYPGLLNRGICYDHTGEYQSALSDFNQALRVTDEESKPYCLSCRARVKEKMNNRNGALVDYETALGYACSIIEDMRKEKEQPFSSNSSKISFFVVDDSTPMGRLKASFDAETSKEFSKAMSSLNTLLDDYENFLNQRKTFEEQFAETSDPNFRHTISGFLAAAKMADTGIQRHKRAMKNFEKNKNLKQYYCTIYFKLEELFVAAKTIASGRVKYENGSLGQVADKMKLLGSSISIVPIVGEPLSNFVEQVLTFVENIDYARQGNIMERIANLGSTIELWEISQEVAEHLARTYEPLIQQLVDYDEDIKFAVNPSEKHSSRCSRFFCSASDCCRKKKKQILKEDFHDTQAKKLADYAVGSMIEYLLNKESDVNKDIKKLKEKDEIREVNTETNIEKPEENFIDAVHKQTQHDPEKKKTLVDELLEAVRIKPKLGPQGRVVRKMEQWFGCRDIYVKDETVKWTIEGFYHGCGIRTNDGKVYVPDNQEIIGFERHGTEEEAKAMGFKQKK